MSLQRLRIGEDTDGLYRAIDAVGRAEYSYFGTWSPFLRRTPHGCDARMRQRLLRADRGLELLDLVGLLPRELNVRAAEVTIRGGLQINRTFQIQLVDNRGGAQVEDLAHGGGDLASRHTLLGAEGLHVDGHRFGNANSVGDLDLDFVSQAGSYDVLRNPTGAYAAERSTLDGSLPENAPPPWWAAPP